MELRKQLEKLYEEKGRAIREQRKVLSNAGTRALSGEEREKVDKIDTALDDLESRIADLERAVKREEDGKAEKDDEDDEEREDDKDDEEREEEDDEEKDDKRSKRSNRPGRVETRNGKRVVTVGNDTRTTPQRRNDGANEGTPVRFVGESEGAYQIRCRRMSTAYRQFAARYILGETKLGSNRRDVQSDIDTVGGYLVMPQQFVNQLIKAVDNLLWIRQVATKYTVSGAQSLGFPTLDTDASDSDWTSELATGNLDTAFAFGKRELIPKPIAKRLKVSNKLLRQASISGTWTNYDSPEAGGTGPIENFLIGRLRYKLAVPQEKAFMTGNGINQPLGVFTASTRGISTARDVQTGSSTGITGDGLIAAKYSLKQQYHTTAKWLFSRTAVKLIRQLKDSYGQYLWQPGLQLGAPDVLLNLPIMMSEYVPTTFTTGNYVGMLADFSFYAIADSVDFQIQRLEELYAEANQTGYITRSEVDGMPVLEEAFARLITN